MIKKPLSYKIYDYTKGGIDIPDQRMGSKHLQHSITHILEVENNKVEQPPPNDNTPKRCKMCVIASYGKGQNQLKIQWAK